MVAVVAVEDERILETSDDRVSEDRFEVVPSKTESTVAETVLK